MEVKWIFKPIGWTPKECADKLRLEEKKKYAFAGRLDPMACGLMPIIINPEGIETGPSENKRIALQSAFKTYRFSIIMGFQTDTYDILGMVEKKKVDDAIICNISEQDLHQVKRRKMQTYPAFSSKTIYSEKHKKQIPLWQLAKEKSLPSQDQMPTRPIVIQSIQILDSYSIKGDELLKMIEKRIRSINNEKGIGESELKTDFRQEEIWKCWNEIINGETNYSIYNLEAKVSSGTYIRSIANDLGGVAFDIMRSEMGDKVLTNPNAIDKFTFHQIQ